MNHRGASGVEAVKVDSAESGKEEMKLHVVTKGEYSDYSICGIYSTAEKAEEAKRLYAADEVEEWELDKTPAHLPGHWPYSVRMDIDGNSDVEPSAVNYMVEEARPYGDGVRVSFDVWAKDEAHAVKIANERRAQLIASGQWQTDWEAWRRGKANPSANPPPSA
jgi:hypothetical protein